LGSSHEFRHILLVIPYTETQSVLLQLPIYPFKVSSGLCGPCSRFTIT
jgi:hypothetical protein